MIYSLIKQAKKELVTSKKYIIYTYVISFMTMLPLFLSSPSLVESRRLLLLMALFIFLIFISKFNKLIWGLFVIYLNFSSLVIFHTFMHWGYNGGLRWFAVIESPSSETYDYLQTYLDWKDGLLILYIITILYFLYRILKHYAHKFKIIKFIGLIISVLIMFMLSLVQNPFKVEPLGIPWGYYKAKIYLEYPKLRTKKMVKLLNYKSKKYQGLYDKVIIIQGESSNKNHMSIYGYHINTTPFLNELKENKGFFLFDAIAPANQTRLSVPIINTPARVGNFLKPYMNNLSLIGEFHIHGFKTHVISSQRSKGLTNATIGSLYQEAKDIFVADLEGKRKTDLVLVKFLEDIKNFDRKEMFFFHLIGSHFDYDKRYNENIMLIKKPTNLLEKYDNSIYFTDYVVKKIFKFFTRKFQNEYLLLVYMSDHGEMVSKNTSGHGYTPPYKEEYDVPFIIYSNLNNPRIKEIVEINKKNIINLESFYDIVMYITGLSDKLNISFSKKVNCLEPEIIFDYDSLNYSKSNP